MSTTTTPRTSWLRRQRWWLLAVPVAFVILIAGSAYRLHDYWWIQDSHNKVDHAAPGEFATLHDEFKDAEGTSTRTVKVRFRDLRSLSTFEDKWLDERTPPEGTRAVEVILDFEAETDQELNYCSVELVSSTGQVFGGPTFESLTADANPCLVEGQEGPASAAFEGQERGAVAQGAERPPTWTTKPVVIIDADADIVAARIWYAYPNYIELDAPAD